MGARNGRVKRAAAGEHPWKQRAPLCKCGRLARTRWPIALCAACLKIQVARDNPRPKKPKLERRPLPARAPVNVYSELEWWL